MTSPNVTVTRIADPRAFAERTLHFLLADEARHNLLLGLATTLVDHPGLYPEHRLWVAETGGDVVGACLRTPPRGLVLARAEPTAARALAAAVDADLPGVVAALPEVTAFADAWTARTGATSTVRVRQGIYALTAVNAPPTAPGRVRGATTADRGLIVDWWRAFAVEALGEPDPDVDEIEQAVDHRLGTHGWGVAIWEWRGEPVSMSGFGGRTPNGMRIGPVYTPPAQRGHGYASAVVAAVSSEQLALGRRFCFLYTDLANPVSNRIYERIGYELVCESAEIAFALPR